MRRLSIITWACVALLAGCGGSSFTGGSSSSSGSSSGGTNTVTQVAVTSSATQISADGTTTATITATAKDANNVVVSGASIAFTTSAGTLTAASSTTDVNGQATATIAAGSAAVGTTIKVTASSGSGSGNVSVTVVGTQQTLSLTTSTPQISSDGTQTATLTALVRDANNNLISGVPVTFSATSGGITVVYGTTGNGQNNTIVGAAVATLSAANDPSNRTITVTATAGSATATVPVSVTGTTLSLSGPPNLVLGSQGTYTIALANSGKVGIPNTAVTLTSAAGNTLSAPQVTTGSNGQVTFTLTASKSGADTITATSLGLTATQAVAVSGQNFVFTTPAASASSTSVPLGTAQNLVVNWSSGGSPVVGQTVNFAATRGTLSSATAVTDSQGNATVSITSGISGPATITASATAVSATTNLDFIATTPASINLQASPATIATQGQSTITATVRDANNNLVEGKTVDFATVADITGGSLSIAAVQTNVEGQAQTVYQASGTASATNGVVLQATVQGTTISSTVDLTVGGQTVFLSLGTGNKVGENASQTQFQYPYLVTAVDAGGNPVPNVVVTLTVHPITYIKGSYKAGTTQWLQVGNGPGNTPVSCPNEDANFNGVLDPGEDGCSAPGVAWDGRAVVAPNVCNPDGNDNGKLDPGGTAVASPSTVTTDATGSATFLIEYPEDQALWVGVELIATTTTQGTESTASAQFVLPIVASYLTTLTAQPPGDPSPYGQAASCTNPN